MTIMEKFTDQGKSLWSPGALHRWVQVQGKYPVNIELKMNWITYKLMPSYPAPSPTWSIPAICLIWLMCAVEKKKEKERKLYGASILKSELTRRDRNYLRYENSKLTLSLSGALLRCRMWFSEASLENICNGLNFYLQNWTSYQLTVQINIEILFYVKSAMQTKRLKYFRFFLLIFRYAAVIAIRSKRVDRETMAWKPDNPR